MLSVSGGESAEFEVSSTQDIEYFDRREDGLFELKKFRGETGLTIEFCPLRESSGKIRISPLAFSLQIVEKRAEIPGVSLPVGHEI